MLVVLVQQVEQVRRVVAISTYLILSPNVHQYYLVEIQLIIRAILDVEVWTVHCSCLLMSECDFLRK